VKNSGTTTRYASAQQQELWLRSATAWQRKPRITSVRAGTEIVGYLERYLGVSKKAQPAAEAFMKAIGTELAEYCRPDKYEKGVLYVHCLPGPCLHQLRTEQAKIIETIKILCPAVKLRALRFTVKY
jgi:hypothetical protein